MAVQSSNGFYHALADYIKPTRLDKLRRNMAMSTRFKIDRTGHEKKKRLTATRLEYTLLTLRSEVCHCEPLVARASRLQNTPRSFGNDHFLVFYLEDNFAIQLNYKTQYFSNINAINHLSNLIHLQM